MPVAKSKVSICVEYDKQLTSTAQLFYDTGSGYTEEHSFLSEIADKKAEFIIDEDTISKINLFRLDPVGEQQDDFSIEEVSVRCEGKDVLVYSSVELRKYVLSVANAVVDEENMKLTNIQADSNIYFSEDFASNLKKAVEDRAKSTALAKKIVRAALIFCSIIVIVLFVQFIIGRNKNVKEVLKKVVEKNRLQKSGIFKYIILVISNILILTIVIFYTIKDFLIENFSDLSFAEIVFHLKVPMEGTSTDMVSEYFKAKSSILIITVLCLVAANICILKIKQLLLNRLTYIFSFDCSMIAFLLIGGMCLNQLGMVEYLKNQMESSKFIEDNYVKPDTVNVTFPEKKRNLIYIFMESMESTFISKDEGGAMNYNLIPELTKLAQDNTNFSEDSMVGGSYATYGSNWTVGAMVTQTSGLPLLLPIDINSYGDYVSFLPGAVTLGEILQKAGYNQELMVGSDVNFGGRGLYFSQHGNYKLWDYQTAKDEGKISQDYRVWWGFEDKKLYEYAKDEITKIADKDEPFNFTMLTVDTHHIGGYKCDLCGDKYDDQYENVLACASAQVDKFVKWLQKQDFYERIRRLSFREIIQLWIMCIWVHIMIILKQDVYTIVS